MIFFADEDIRESSFSSSLQLKDDRSYGKGWYLLMIGLNRTKSNSIEEILWRIFFLLFIQINSRYSHHYFLSGFDKIIRILLAILIDIDHRFTFNHN